MKTFLTRLLIFLSLAAQIALSISPFVPWVKENIWTPQTSVSGFASTLATYIGLQFTCLGILVALVLLDIVQRSKEATDQFRNLLETYTPLHVRQLKEEDFYKEFLGNCVKAQHHVKICYFAPNPPQQGAPRFRENYYQQLPTVIKKNPNTIFKRIIRDTPENRTWANELAMSLLDSTNCYIALLKDVDQQKEMPLALSIQIVDDANAWLVAIAEHAGAPMYRDVAIANEVIVGVFGKYFDRLWGLSRVVFQPGDSAAKVNKAINEEE